MRVSSTAATVENGVATFTFAQYGATLQATIGTGELSGDTSGRAARRTRSSQQGDGHHGAQHRQCAVDRRDLDRQREEHQGRDRVAIHRQTKRRRRIGDDSARRRRHRHADRGYRDGKFVLSHFSGARPLLLEVTPAADGTLQLKQNGQTELVAAKEGASRAAAIGTPTDPAEHTRMKNPGERLQFSFRDLEGRTVSHTDPKFAGKVLLVNISGSWCPNCHDEAPFLADLYRKYRARGLEVVTFSFEEEDQLANPTRLRAFIKNYALDYTVLLAGIPDDLEAKVPQAENLNAFPTTFLLGRDGRVRAIHAGFPSAGSGEFYSKAQRDIIGHVERLLGERAGTEGLGIRD